MGRSDRQTSSQSDVDDGGRHLTGQAWTGLRSPQIQGVAVVGMAISLGAGVLYTRRALPVTRSEAAIGGASAGGVCALIGIVVSYGLGDVPALVVAFGTLSSAATGAIGGLLGGRKGHAPA